MGPVTPVDLPLIDQSEVGFVYKSGWLQRMAGYLAPQLRACDTSRLVVDDWDELVKRVSSAIADRKEKVSAGAGGHILRGSRRRYSWPARCLALAGPSTQVHLREKHAT